MSNSDFFTIENVKYSKIDIEKALEKLSENSSNNYNYKSDNTGEEYSILYNDNRYSIKRIYEQMRINKNLLYENKIGSSKIKEVFSKYFEILPRIGSNNNPELRQNIISNLKKEFKNYLNELYPDGIPDKTYIYDPFYLINDEQTPIKNYCKEHNIFFWKLFENDKNLEEYYNLRSNFKDANKNTNSSYKSNTNRLKDFFNQKYGGYINWLKSLSNMLNYEIDFDKICEFFKKYSNQKYNKNDKNMKQIGQTAAEEFSKFLDYINFNNEFKHSFTKNMYQHGTGNSYCASYFWAQYKKNKYIDEPYSISIAICLDDNKNLQLFVKTEIQDDLVKNVDNKKQNEYVKNFLKSSRIIPEGFILQNIKIDDTNFEKSVLVQEINLNQKTENIIENTKQALQRIVENYNAIFAEDNQQKNQILYGPPGTGKTYNTVVEAMKILDNDLYKKYDSEENLEEKSKIYQDEILPKFKDFKQDGRIEFITFHQSYSYEEFVEGIKPEIDWDDEYENQENISNEINYVGKNGIFKKICQKAEEKLYNNSDINIEFDDVIKRLKDELSENPFIKNIKRGKIEINEIKDGENTIQYYYGKTKTKKNFSLDKMKLLFEQNKNYDNADLFFKDYHHESYSVRHYPFAFYKNLLRIKQDLLKEKTFNIIEEKKEINLNAEKCVLIIDEINRGNISKIFGELITLIEEDKRIGEDHEMRITLPYSQDPNFGVPSNLYIIGTMNTSDRSIASVDIALRRRFKFKEMMPDSNLVPEFFRKKFETLNKKISILLDRDHQIGHSYFINIKEDDLQRVWFDSVMPLLNEYFYGDWEKLQEILGDAEEKNGGKYQSFIKKLDMSIIRRTECQDYEGYDFVKENEIDFESALSHAFSDK